jgi:DNA repair protein RadA/Sms
MKVAKETDLPIFLIGHITKEGSLAGPKVLEHIVDVVLQFEGDPNFVYRLIRVHKNRFGATHELGIYEMVQEGLRIVSNPSEVLVSSQDNGLSGVAIASIIEGIRPLKLEVQALVSPAAYGTPQRAANGFDAKRLQMLLAVLEKRCNFKLYQRDVFLNIAGGISAQDPAMDLAIIAAIVSSVLDQAISRKTCFAAEVALTGEIRPISRIDQRITEAQRLGYTRVIVSGYHEVEKQRYTIDVVGIMRVSELFGLMS